MIESRLFGGHARRLFRCVRLLLLFVIFSVSGALNAAAYPAAAIKAAYLHRFASYVEWPAPFTEGPLVIGVHGAEAVAEQLDLFLPTIRVSGRAVEVRRILRPEDIQGVQILYVGSFDPRAIAILNAAREHPILVVTDDRTGLERGSVVNFVQAERNLRFEVSLSEARRRQLTIRSGLLAVALRVEEGPSK